jgi:hypothetical protein
MQIKTLSFQKHQGLSLVEFSTEQKNSFEYISASSAIKKKFIEVKEVDKEGSVGELFLINSSDKYVFFIDGDILQGAKQNRVLNTSVLVAPNSKINLPVSCVEQGRWRFTSSSFVDAEYISPQKLRAKKAESVKHRLRRELDYLSDQGEVWNDVYNYLRVAKVGSKTSNLSDYYDSKKFDFENFVSNFSFNTEANGIALFFDDSLLNIDVFNRTDIYQEYFPKILKSTAMEISVVEKKQNNLTEADAFGKTVDCLGNLEKIKYTSHPGVGVGEEKRFDDDTFTGLELDYNEHLIHLTLLNLKTSLYDAHYVNRRIRIR